MTWKRIKRKSLARMWRIRTNLDSGRGGENSKQDAFHSASQQVALGQNRCRFPWAAEVTAQTDSWYRRRWRHNAADEHLSKWQQQGAKPRQKPSHWSEISSAGLQPEGQRERLSTPPYTCCCHLLWLEQLNINMIQVECLNRQTREWLVQWQVQGR